ncbi:MAG TPA: TetR/AcrR family transcriptional regulator [Candidatus Dormibacteraeota bacterium]|jgi:AcrR family transcriptional regulator|nr:TetR/AcrR family transcriptional regulator [Candidatus Dormibacteraeota bacterium]
MNMRTAQKEETRSRILAASVALFEADHQGEVKLKDIAAEAGVSIPTLLFHFGSRLQLLTAVGEELFAKAEHHGPEPGVEGGTLAAIERYLHPRRSRAVRAVWRVGDEVAWLSPQTTEPYAERFRDRLYAHLIYDGFDKRDADILADLLAPALMMVGRRMQVNQAPEELARRFVEAARLLIENWPAQGAPRTEPGRALAGPVSRL